MVQQNCQEETTNSENPLQGGNKPVGSEDLSGELQGEPEGPQNKHNQKMTVTPGETPGLFKVTSSIVITMCRKKKQSLFHLQYIDLTRATDKNLDVLQEKRVDDSMERGRESEFIRFLERIHEVL